MGKVVVNERRNLTDNVRGKGLLGERIARGMVFLWRDVILQIMHGEKWSFGRDVMLLTVQEEKGFDKENRDVTDCARGKRVVRDRIDFTM